MHLTLYAGAFNPVPVRADTFDTWDELRESVIDLVAREYATKTDMLAIAPHRLKQTCVLPATARLPEGTPYRALANIDAVTALVLDVDKALIDADALAERLFAFEPDALMYASPSDPNPDGTRRVRIIAPCVEHSMQRCALARFAFAEAIGLVPGQGVEGAKDAAKIFFAGRLVGTPAREVWRL